MAGNNRFKTQYQKQGVMKIGYARVSTLDQVLDSQIDALTGAGVDRVFSETASGAKTDRIQLGAVLEFLRKGDTLVILKFDRLGRSLSHLLNIAEDLASRGVHLQSLTEGIDTATPAGKLFFALFGALAEFERDLIKERTNRGLAAAKARGKLGGRPRKLSAEKLKAIRQMADNPEVSISTIVDTYNISKSTYYRALEPSNK
jgi:DNA invertase Pin-like site-specific DNA recombinase